MIDKSIRTKREELKNKSTTLQSLYLDIENYSNYNELRKNQNETYKKWQFYDNFIKAMEKVK